MTIKQWLDSRVGKGIDDDGAYGFQCMDLYADYQRHLLQVPVKGAAAAKDVWNTFNPAVFTKIPNSPSFVPKRGDIAIWTNGTYGHIAVCEGEGNVNWFVSLDQNWFSPWNGTGKATYVRHDYTGVVGFLRPKKDINFDQAAYNAEQARIAEANRVAIEKAKIEADRLARLEAERIAKEQKAIADEQAKLAKELAAKLEADKLVEEAKKEAERARVAEEEEKRKEEALKQELEPIKEGEDMTIAPRFKSPVVWTAILAQILLVVALFMPQISEPVKIVGTVLIQMLTLLGILNNPTDPESF